MHRRILALAVVALALPGAGWASTWEIDPVHSSVGFSVRHLMISNVRGNFRDFAGTVEVDEARPTEAEIEATIAATSIDTGNEKRDQHLRSADFLDVAVHPEIRFVSKRIERLQPDRWKIIGDLTLHGVTREVVLDFEGPTQQIEDPSGATRAGGRATTKIDRKDFGITWNKGLDGGGVVVGDTIDVTIEVEVKRRGARAQPGAGGVRVPPSRTAGIR